MTIARRDLSNTCTVYRFGSCCTVLCLGVIMRSREDLDWRKVLGRFLGACGHMLVSLLELVVPLVEVDVENDNGPGGKSSHQEFLVVGESKTSDAGVASRESVEERQIERPPHLDNAFVSSRHHVLSVS